jgi:lipoprotein-anchoring transpeptidase ErfK/SrfK
MKKQHGADPIQLLRSFLVAVLLGAALTLSVMAGFAAAQEGRVIERIPPEPTPVSLGSNPNGLYYTTLPISYARVITNDVPVYADPISATLGLITPTRSLGTGFLWVSLAETEPISYNGRAWYKINEGEYVQAEHLKLVPSSTFHGIEFARHPEFPVGWIVRKTPVLPWPGAPVTADTPHLTRYTVVTIYETNPSGEWGWRRIGEDQWVNLYDVGAVLPSPRPAVFPPGNKWIEVNLFEQTFAAYDEQDDLVYGTLISSGLWGDGWHTPTGTFYIHSKIKTDKMRGGGKADYYFIEDVQMTMPFHQMYAFHAAYWHDDFGRRKSHGCVNMSPQDAQWLFNWSTPVITPGKERIKANDDNPGTWVWIHD